MDPGLVKTFETMQQHRSVLLFQDVSSHHDDAVRAHANEVLVVGSVMKLAKREHIRNRGLAAFAVGDDVRGIKELAVPQAAKRTLGPVRTENPLSERSLVNADLELARHIAATFRNIWLDGGGRRRGHLVEVEHRSIIELDSEEVPDGIVSDHEDRPCGKVAPGNEGEEIDEGDPLSHELPEPCVVPMGMVGTPVRVEEAALATRAVVVGT